MARRAANNPRQMRSKTCGCPLCVEHYPPAEHGERKKRRDCLGSWQARYRDPTGDQKARNFTKEDGGKTAADAFLDKTRTAVRERTYLDPTRGEITLGAWWKEWWPGHEPEKTTTRNRKLSSWTVHIEPKWGRRKLISIRSTEVQAWMRTDVKGYATQVKVRELFRALMRDAVQDDRIVKNPLQASHSRRARWPNTRTTSSRRPRSSTPRSARPSRSGTGPSSTSPTRPACGGARCPA